MPLTDVMDMLPEVAVISDSSNQTTNCAVYDLKNGSLIASFKEGHSVPKGLAFIGHDHLISALADVPFLKVWKVSKENFEEDKMICAGKVLCLAVSNCGRYCVAGIGKSIHVWEVQTGNIMNTLTCHSQNVTCLKFTSDGYYFISGGKDGLVLVWRLAEVICIKEVRPRFTWMHHAGEITDIHVGNSGQYARVVTASSDMTCKIYELDTGNNLTSISTDYTITAATMDRTECYLILGCSGGNLYKINLWPVRDGELISSESKQGVLAHSGTITCLSASLFGKCLISGAKDGFCKIWDLYSLTCLTKLPFEGPITNAFITILPPGLRSEGKYEPRLSVNKFKRESEPNPFGVVCTRIPQKKLSLMHCECPDNYFSPGILNFSDESQYVSKTKISLKSMEEINKQLYAYALSDTMSMIHRDSDSE